jgi:DNA-directed RNA polymerase subunit RPC12/RpoP
LLCAVCWMELTTAQATAQSDIWAQSIRNCYHNKGLTSVLLRAYICSRCKSNKAFLNKLTIWFV